MMGLVDKWPHLFTNDGALCDGGSFDVNVEQSNFVSIPSSTDLATSDV